MYTCIISNIGRDATVAVNEANKALTPKISKSITEVPYFGNPNLLKLVAYSDGPVKSFLCVQGANDAVACIRLHSEKKRRVTKVNFVRNCQLVKLLMQNF